MSRIDRLLHATMKTGGRALRMVPNRRLLVVTADGEREVKGPEQSEEEIRAAIEGLAPPERRHDALERGAAWQLEVEGIGEVQVRCGLTDDGPELVFQLPTPSEEAVPPRPEPARAAEAVPGPVADGEPEQAMRRMLCQMAELGASDLHVSAGSRPMVRHDGEMKALPGLPPLSPEQTERLLLSIAPERNREEFRTTRDTDFAYEIADVGRFRANVFEDRRGVGGVFRIIPHEILTVEDMGLPDEILSLCHLPKGLVLVTGPTGSGKSTTLAALIDYINRNRSDHIITIEDPVEFVHENKRCLVNQREVGVHTRSFKSALRAALREDPDIVLVGEMRDLETIAIALETAETGHLVFGTLHTSSAPSTIDRIIDQFPADRQEQIRVMLSGSLKGVISQVLCKRVGGGRVPAMEVMVAVPAISNLIREGKVFQIPSIMQTSRKVGMCQLNDSLADLVKSGVVTADDAHARATDKPGLLQVLKKRGIDTDGIGAGGAGPVAEACVA